MTNLTDILLWAILVYFISKIIIGFMNAYADLKLEALTNIKTQLNKVIHRVSIEAVGDHYYWYDADEDMFLAQGATQEEIISVIKDRFPNHTFLLPGDIVLHKSTNWEPKHLTNIASLKQVINGTN